MSDQKSTRTTTRLPEERLMQLRCHGFGSPVGLGLGLVSVGAFFALFAVGLQALASIGY